MCFVFCLVFVFAKNIVIFTCGFLSFGLVCVLVKTASGTGDQVKAPVKLPGYGKNV